MQKFNWTKIDRHTLVSKRASPDDPALKEYWAKRNKKSQKSEVCKWNAKQEQVAYKKSTDVPYVTNRYSTMNHYIYTILFQEAKVERIFYKTLFGYTNSAIIKYITRRTSDIA